MLITQTMTRTLHVFVLMLKLCSFQQFTVFIFSIPDAGMPIVFWLSKSVDSEKYLIY